MRVLACALVAASTVACGDNLHVPDTFEAISGSRIKAEWHLYEDGTRQWSTQTFFDVRLHARCAAQRWIDGVVRCVPFAEEAVYSDASCSVAVGRGSEIKHPTHFVGFDRVAGTTWPARIYRAGTKTAEVAQYFERRDGVCTGPFASPAGYTYFELPREIDGSELVELQDGELGEGRLGLRVLTTIDGLRVPFALRDRDLDIDCRPSAGDGERASCEPIEHVVATHFRDPDCVEAAVSVATGAPAPAFAKVRDVNGCESFHAIGAEIEPARFRRVGDDCLLTSLPPPRRWFSIGAPLDLAALERSREIGTGRRLQRIVLDEGSLRVFDDRLFDTATHATCSRTSTDLIDRCIPAPAVPASSLFLVGCGVEVRVAELPRRSCARSAFAIATTGDQVDIHAIGDPYTGPLFHFDNGQCRPYPAQPDTIAHALGPPLPPATFVGAVTSSER